jgi:hypothetical protein
MPRVGFEPATAVFKGANTVHALDLAVTVIDHKLCIFLIKLSKTIVYIRKSSLLFCLVRSLLMFKVLYSCFVYPTYCETEPLGAMATNNCCYAWRRT